MSTSFGDTINNPGDIKANGVAFQGITSTATVQSNAGPTVTFDVFDTIFDGIRAIAKILNTHLNAAGGSQTVAQVATGYLGTSSNNAENPNVESYIAAVAKGSGLSSTTKVTSANIGQLIQGILTGEGTSGGVTAAEIQQGVQMAGLTSSQSAVQSAAATTYGNFLTGASAIVNDPLGSLGTIGGIYASSATNLLNDPVGTVGALGNAAVAGTSTLTQAATDTATQAVSPITSLFSGFLTQTFATRLVLVLLGVLLLAAAIFAFTKTNPVELVAKAAAV